MAGLYFNLGGAGQVQARPPGTAAPRPATVSEAAFGPSLSASFPSRWESLKPNDATGVTFWAGVGAVGLLVLLYHSLPE